MDLKVTNLAQIQQQNALSNLPETDGSFRFALLSNLQENELQSQLAFMMEEITQQGNRISKRMDVRDMKQYRKLIKEFINEISTHSHKFSRENFLDRKGLASCIWNYQADQPDIRRTCRGTSGRRERSSCHFAKG